MARSGWNRFLDWDHLTWDYVIETGMGEPTEQEEQAILDLGYYGSPINKSSVNALKKGLPFEPPDFSIRYSAPDGSSEEFFDTKEALLEKLSKISVGDFTGMRSFVDHYGGNVSIKGAKVTDVWPDAFEGW